MPSLFERLRNALAPHYTVERELASGGMGMVFLGRDVALQRPVAIKIIRPELATAQAAERFLREARILANLSHPNVVPVHHVGEAGGIFYYVMDFLEGETLASRLARGPLSWRETVKLGRDILDALEASHRLGVVHRDIKPSNVFLINSRAVLADFGIAKPSIDPGRTPTTREQAVGVADQQLTAVGAVVGTPDYMAPEQSAGADVTPRSDLYVVGMVLHEALTGRHWPALELADPDRGDWSGVPRGIARVLRRALRWEPERRWPDAAAFRRALWRTRVWPYRRRTIALTVGGVVAGLGLARVVWLPPAETGTALRVRVEPFVGTGATSPVGLGDSLARAVVGRLKGYPDFAVVGPGERWRGRRAATVVSGSVTSAGDSLRVELRVDGRAAVAKNGPGRAWTVLADSLSDGLVAHLLRSPLDSTVPSGVLPKTAAGMAAFLKAERLFAEARWGDAYVAYGEAAAADTTCWLCFWRRKIVAAWLSLEQDRSEVDRYAAHIDAFPPHYRSLIRADTLPLTARLDTLEAVTRRWRDFLFGQFLRGDELLHRGPLVGHARREAVGPFHEVVRLRPDFAPAWEHLAWTLVADGDSAAAAQALARLDALGEPHDAISVGVRSLIRLAFAWRFLRPEEPRRRTPELLLYVERAGFAKVDAGARFLPHFDAPRGAVEFARLLEGRPSLERSALIAQTFGYVGLGRLDSAHAVLRRLLDRYPEPNLALFRDELEAAQLVFDHDSAGARARWPALRRSLGEQASLRAGSAAVRRRAAWMLSLAAIRLGAASDVPRYRSLLSDEPSPRPLSTLLRAAELASRGQYTRALAPSDTLTLLEAGPDEDPFLRVALHLLRADWYEHEGAVEHGRRELLWHENSDLFLYPTGDPEQAEGDWAFGVLARWRLAGLLDRSGESRDEVCRAYRDVARLWAGGEARYAARADSAARRFAALGCSSPT